MTTHAEKLLTALSDFIDESRVLLEKGAFIELSGFDAQVGELCEGILSLSPEERASYADRLQSLHDRLSQLGDAIMQQRDQVAREITSLGKHRKASVAYASVESSDKK